MIEDQKRVGTIAHYMGMLQGLKAIPFGLLLFVLAAQGMGWLGEAGNCTATLPLFLSMLVLLFVIDSYYIKTIGRMRPVNRREQFQETVLFMSVFAIVIVLENWLATPFSLLGLAMGAFFIYTGVKSRRFYYIPIGVVVLLSSFLPWVQGVPLTDPVFGSLGVMFKVMVGAAIIVAGVIDHFMMMRELKALGQQV